MSERSATGREPAAAGEREKEHNVERSNAPKGRLLIARRFSGGLRAIKIKVP